MVDDGELVLGEQDGSVQLNPAPKVAFQVHCVAAANVLYHLFWERCADGLMSTGYLMSGEPACEPCELDLHSYWRGCVPQILPASIVRPSPSSTWQYLFAGTLFLFTFGSCVQLGLAANVHLLPKVGTSPSSFPIVLCVLF